MGQAIAVRTDFTAGEVRRFARRAKDAAQVRRLLAIAAVLDGASREDAAKIGGMDRQTLRDWSLFFCPTRISSWNQTSTGVPGGSLVRTSATRSAIDLSVRCGLPRTRNRRCPRSPFLQHRSHAASSRRDRRKSNRRRSRDPHSRSGRLARRQGSQHSQQPIAPASAAARAGAQSPRKHLAVHATELAV